MVKTLVEKLNQLPPERQEKISERTAELALESSQHKDSVGVMAKPVFEVDVSKDAPSSLEAHALLSSVDESLCFHVKNGFRASLGIYNVSVSRVCDKVERLCGYLEEYFKASTQLNPLSSFQGVMQQAIDYIELALYAAAEHVDDVYSIAYGFFESGDKAKKDGRFKRLDNAIKSHKKLISIAANKIKHQQSRIRIFSMEFTHDGRPGCLHGYFVEGVESGVVCRNAEVHKEQDVFSVTTLPWEILYLLLNSSRDLAKFLTGFQQQLNGPTNNVSCEPLAKAVVAAARLPLYTFGEDHPFSRATLHLNAKPEDDGKLNSGLFGSIKNGWSKTGDMRFGQSVSRFEGDGSTRSFRFVQPKSIGLQHWD